VQQSNSILIYTVETSKKKENEEKRYNITSNRYDNNYHDTIPAEI
jgi:hypothetical protein